MRSKIKNLHKAVARVAERDQSLVYVDKNKHIVFSLGSDKTAIQGDAEIPDDCPKYCALKPTFTNTTSGEELPEPYPVDQLTFSADRISIVGPCRIIPYEARSLIDAITAMDPRDDLYLVVPECYHQPIVIVSARRDLAVFLMPANRPEDQQVKAITKAKRLAGLLAGQTMEEQEDDGSTVQEGGEAD